MSNLRDQIDIMLNDIGTANEGVLKGTVSIIKTVVENWEIFSQAIHAAAAGFVTYTTTALIAANANGKFASSALAATASSKGLTASMAKIILAFKNLGTFIKTNPITIIVSALTGAIVWWQQHQRAVEENRKSYDPLVNSITRAKDELNALTKEIETQNGKIRDAVSDIDNYSKGTEEYARAEAEANAEREKQNTLLEQLKTKYPEIYAGIVKQKDGTVELTNALKEQNNYLGDAQYLAYLLRDTAGGSDDGFNKQVERASEAMKNLRNDTAEADNAFRAMYSKIQEYFAVNEYASEDLKKSIDEIATGGGNSMEKIYKIFSMVVKEHGVNIGDLRDIVWEYKENADNVRDSTKEWNKESKELAKTISEVAKTYIQDIDVSTEEGRKRAENALKTLLQMLGIQEKAVRDFVEQTFEVEIGVKLNLEPAQKVLGGFEKQINDYLDKHQFSLIGRIQPEGDADKFFDKLAANLSDYKKELEQVTQATEQLYASEGKTNEKRAEELRNIISQIETTQKAFGRFDETSKGGGSSKDPMLDRFKEMIKLIEEAKKRYDELNEEFSSEVATQMVRTQFADTPAGDIIATMTFDAQGVVDGLNKAIQSTGKAAQEEYRKVFQDASRPFETKLLLEPQIEKREELEQQIEDLFSQYELSIQLSSTGVPGDVIKNLFNTDIIDLETLKEKLKAMQPVFEAQGLNWLEVWKDVEKRLTEITEKETQERLKRYAEYMKESISERTRIEIEAQKEIAKVQSMKDLSPNTKDAVSRTIRKNADIEIGKLDWEDFQGSEIYQRLFRDLEYLSTASIERIKAKLDELKNSMGELSPENLKTINEYYSQLESELSERNPFAAMRDSLKEINELRKQGKSEESLQGDLLKLDTDASNYEQQIRDLELIISAKEEGLSLDSLSSDVLNRNNSILNKSTEELRMMLSLRQGQLSQTKSQIGITQKDLDSYTKARKNAEQLSGTIDSIKTLGNTAFGSITEILDAMGDGMSENDKIIAEMTGGLLNLVAQAVMFGVQLQLNTALAEIMGYTINAALGPIGWAVMALQALTSIFTAFARIHDNKLQEQIEEEQEKIDNLNKTYEKLEETIENGLSIFQYSKSGEQIDILLEQIKSYERMIDLERDKKKTDEKAIQQWKSEIESIYSQIDDIYNDVKEELVGSFKDAASQLADALQNAFENGEDAAKSWGETVNSIIADIIKNAIATKLIEPLLQPLLDNFFAEAMPKTEAASNFKDEYENAVEELAKIEQELNQTSPLSIKWWNLSKEYEDIQKYVNSMKEQYDALNEAATGEIPTITEGMVDDLQGGITGILDYIKDNGLLSMLEDLTNSMEETEGDAMSGLQRGIEGLSERTGQALEALLESCRYFISDSNTVLHNFYNAFQTPNEENPFLAELRNQTSLIQSINNTLSRLTRNATSNGLALKVQIV